MAVACARKAGIVQPFPVGSRSVHRPVSRLLRVLRLDACLPSGPGTRSALRSLAARALLVWAVLAGLFLMHGAASAGGCQDGAAVTAITAATTPVPAAVTDSAVTGAVHLAAAWTPARPAAVAARAAAAVAARPPAVSSPALSPSASQATAADGCPMCGRMLCSSRQPRQGFLSAFVIRLAGAVPIAVMAVPLLRCPAAVLRRPRPPGRPGLPLPLFLGVCRT